MQKVRIAQVGVGGFGWEHYNQIKRLSDEGRVERIAVAEMAQQENTEALGELKNNGVRIYADARELFEQEQGNLDLVTLPVGIALHAPLAIAAMEAGYNVLSEKPPAATIEDVDAMIAASQATGKFCAVQFQHMSCEPLRELKQAILDGQFGTLKELAVHAFSPRGDDYYNRHGWAGQLQDRGAWVLDGPMNNAFAHQVMDLLFLAGPSMNEAAWPERVRAELYHARNLTGSDTSALLAELPGGVKLFHGVTHACVDNSYPVYRIVGSQKTLSGSFAEIFPALEGNPLEPSFDGVIDFAAGESDQLNCPVSMTRAFTATINAAHESSGGVHAIPSEYSREVSSDHGGIINVSGISDALARANAHVCTFSDLGVPWAQKSDWIEMNGYATFAGVA